MSIPAILFWVLAAAALLAPEGFAMALFICSAPFGALNTLPEGVGGGVNLLPQSVAVLVFAARIFSRGVSPELVLKPLMNWRGFALFAAFVAYAIFTAMVLPHMFEGRVDVIPMDDPVRQPLHPSGANFNQSAYLVVDLIAAMTLFVYLRRGEGEAREKLFGALLVSGALYVATGLIEYSGALPQVVASFRNASYNLFSNTEIAGVRRITGFFPEASAYGPRCVVMGALLFFGRFALRGGQLRNWWAPALSLALIAMGALSTSSTAFVAIFVFAALVIIRTALQLRRRVGYR